jgi:hypothetical protein
VDSLGLNLRFLLNHTVETSAIFKLLEGAKQQALLDDYGLSQYTLEQIFNTFARDNAKQSRIPISGHPDDSE